MSHSNSKPRLYSTIGIHNVFLSPITEEEFPQSYLAMTLSAPFITPEIIGTIKANPEDFYVRELASDMLGLSAECNVAELRDSSALVESANHTKPASKEQEKTDSIHHPVPNVENDLQPLEVVRRVLQSQHPETWNAELAALLDLQEKALLALQDYSSTTSSIATPPPPENNLWIPPISSDSSCLTAVVQRSGDRGSFHRCLKLAFPLLQSETIKQQNGEPSLIKVSMDTSFFALAPSIHSPAVDTLHALYTFRKHGVPAVDGKNNKKRKRGDSYVDGDPYSFVLPLRPDISKDDRRKLHHLISSQTRDFETSTLSNYKLADGTTTTTALILTWSKAAIRAASSSGGEKSKECLVFVLKKRQKEHLAAIHALTRILRCRQSDIGIAGIKDMHAVTYQFCTIRGIKPDRLLHANMALKHHGMEIGSVQVVNHFLQSGQLKGNRFIIVVRDVKRVHLESHNDKVEEKLRPCLEHDKEHVLARADAVKKFGFVNFYGAQRLGTPGEPEVVGVRSFDIGRAMLQGDFDRAVDLLMTGRLICRGIDEQENPSARKCRQIWRDTGGNVEETLKAMPKGDSMAREQTVLQGLKRYQNSLDALKCLHFRERTFWINAYQSYVWNLMTSERLRFYGKKVVPGDLTIGTDGNVVVVTDDTIDSISLHQVVLPLPGYNVQYPVNEIGKRYEQFLQHEKVKFEKEARLEATAKGSYRHVTIPMTSLELAFPESPENDFNSFQISFDLPSGSYATMLLRELMVTTVARSVET
jgi:TruD family tRNA pseudouridine synthase